MDWQVILSVVALAISALALVASWVALRQRVRYHPQPKLVVEWEDQLQPSGGFFFRRMKVTNHGDAPARDLRLIVEHADTSPWDTIALLAEGESITDRIPVVDRVSWGESGMGVVYERSGEPGDFRFVTPRVTLVWRQAPFAAAPKRQVERPPKTPNLRESER